jgi:sensor histidine kinase regulating citrate/malate metabolism
MTIYVLLIIILIITANAALWIFLIPQIMDQRIRRFQNDLVNRHYDEIKGMYSRMSRWRHDYHNHLQVIKADLEMERYEDAVKYLDGLESDLRAIGSSIVRTGNVVADAIINSKLTLIRERGIRVETSARVPENISVSGVDLSILIGNLLDNAMEACAAVPIKSRFINFNIDIIKKQLYISVENSAPGRVTPENGRYVSTKTRTGGEVHGFGLQSIDMVTARYNGTVSRESDETVFTTRILIPLN